MLKDNAAASRKAAGAGAAASASSPVAAAAAPARVPLLQLTSLASSGGGKDFSFQSPTLHTLRHSPLLVVDVWASNLRAVFEQLASLVDDYPYVAMDTEFPGVVARPLTTPPAGAGKASLDAYRYQTIKCNVELLRLLQLGLAFCNEKGEVSAAAAAGGADSTGAAAGVVFQFHFKFNLDADLYAQDSIDLLQRSGLDLARHSEEGIDVSEFAELMLTSGIVLNEDVRWLTFHAGFDFAYLLHLLLGGGQGGPQSGAAGNGGNVSLPAAENDFFELLTLYFPCIYDVKALARALPPAAAKAQPALAAEVAHGGLDRLAQTLGQARLCGAAHTAGSDALLTAAVFFKLRDLFFAEDLTPPPTVAQMQQAAAAAAAASGDAAKASDADATSPTASSSSEAALTAFAQREEQYLNHLFGLSPLANTLLRAQRDKERAQTAAAATAGNDEDSSAAATTASGSSAARGRNDRT